jgi:hypothetical protein
VARLPRWGKCHPPGKDEMHLPYISIPALIAEAGGDPWTVNNSLQAGRPVQIADLAETFYKAGRCTAEASVAFDDARRRFEASWNRESGEHPINDSAEVRRAVTSLGVQTAQLPKIGVDLENIAAALAQVQRTGAEVISTLESRLKQINNELRQAVQLKGSHQLTAAEKALIDQHIHDLEDGAVTDTKSALGQLQSLRNGYSDYLRESLVTLRAQEGYDPAPIQGLDDDGLPSRSDQDQKFLDRYNMKQHAIDQALVNRPGGMTAEKRDAATRLRDYATATNPAADADARRLAGERLDDFAMAQFSGPLPIDPTLGGNARSRAQMRLQWQKKLQEGLSDALPMNPDQVTQMLDDSEQQARAVVTREAAKALERGGMSGAGAMAVVGKMATGTPLSEIAHQDATLVGAVGAGMAVSAGSVSTGAHNLPDSFGVLSKSDAEALKRVGGHLGTAGSLADLVLAGIELNQGAPIGTTIGKTAGGIGGGIALSWGLGAAGGMVFGPGGAFVGAALGATLGGWGGGEVGEAVGSQFDH